MEKFVGNTHLCADCFSTETSMREEQPLRLCDKCDSFELVATVEYGDYLVEVCKEKFDSDCYFDGSYIHIKTFKDTNSLSFFAEEIGFKGRTFWPYIKNNEIWFKFSA